jgi:LytS/YehU family sensor histidine kinase
MILIAFVENIFKHGVSSNKDKNEFNIEITVENGHLNFSSSNNIAQKSNELEVKVEKTGIKNVERRLELIYPDEYNLSIENNKDKFQVDLQIKLNN